MTSHSPVKAASPGSPTAGVKTAAVTTKGATNSSAGSASATSDSNYMAKHQLPALVEYMLGHVVPSRHPRPYEVASLLTFPNPPPLGAKALTASSTEPATLGKPGPDAMLDSLHFDVFALDSQGPEAVDFVVNIFHRHNIPATFDITIPKLTAWVQAVQRNYRPAAPMGAKPPAAPSDFAVPADKRRALEGEDSVPFHNFRHAINVLHSLHVFLEAFEAKQFFDDLEIFAMLLAAVCHDLQHPGRDNNFLKVTGHPIAERYNDVAVLEMHHCATTFAILSDPAIDLCSAFRYEKGDAVQGQCVLSPEYKRFRDCVVKCILGTEVASHKSHVEALSSLLSSFQPKTDVSHRLKLMVCLVEAADLSNEVRAFPFSRQWAPLVEEEFCRQGDVERALGLPVPSSRDRDAVSMGKEQAGFIAFLCLPLYEALAKVLPKMEECVRNLKANKDTWAALPG
jgi:hypothetical protein